MIIEVVEKEGLKREVTIEVPADLVDKTYGKFYDEFRRQAKIDGFRPGKAPANIIKSRFKAEVTAEVVDELVKECFGEAIKEKNLDPVGTPILSHVDQVDEGKPFRFTINIEIMPQIDQVKYEKLQIQKADVQVPDEGVEQVMAQLRKSNADLRTVDRPAGDTDIVICDFEVAKGDPNVFDNQPVQNQEIDLGHEHTDPEFRDGLLGSRRDDIREITISYPPDYPNQKFAGRQLTYAVTVKEVKERLLPTVDDDFARQVAGGKTLLELKLDIRKELEASAARNIDRANRKMIIDQVVSQNQIVVPDSMVESYLKNVIEDYKQNAATVDEAELREKYRPVGVNTIRWVLLFHRLAGVEKIEVLPSDTENWIKRFADNYRMDVPKAKEVLSRTGRINDIKDGILEDKVLDFLLTKAEVRETQS